MWYLIFFFFCILLNTIIVPYSNTQGESSGPILAAQFASSFVLSALMSFFSSEAECYLFWYQTSNPTTLSYLVILSASHNFRKQLHKHTFFFFKESVFSYLVIQIYHEEIENTNLCMILFKDHFNFLFIPFKLFFMIK